MRAGFPHWQKGQVIGLLGGSFDPAHEGHVAITKAALTRLGLDAVWWLVSPGNPLKGPPMAPLAVRLAKAQAVMDHPRVKVTALEAGLGTVRTAESLAALQRQAPGLRFVWLMGADNLQSLHHWYRWQAIMSAVPVAVFARPGAARAPFSAPAARAFRAARCKAPSQLRFKAAPAWAYVTLPLNPASASALRAKGLWGARGARL